MPKSKCHFVAGEKKDVEGDVQFVGLQEAWFEFHALDRAKDRCSGQCHPDGAEVEELVGEY